MIHYFDASSLLAVFFREAGSQQIRQRLEDARVRVGTELLFAEVLCSLHRVGPHRLPPEDLVEVIEEWHVIWASFTQIPMPVVMAALPSVLSYRLRAADALHLAACLHLADIDGGLTLHTRDGELSTAAKAANLQVVW